MFKHVKKLVLLAAVLGLASCSSPRQANIDYDRTVDFSQYQTFAFYQPAADPPAADSSQTAKPAYDPLLDQHFKAAITREMTALGYRLDEVTPQLLVNYQTNVENREDVRSSPFSINAGYGYYGRNSAFSFGFPLFGGSVEKVNYKVGTILIHVIDANAKRVVWQGMLEGRLSNKAMQNPQQAINDSVALIYQRYPTRLTQTP
jgi:hypothetical protein